MKYLGKITDNKDLVTKEYVDGRSDTKVTQTATSGSSFNNNYEILFSETADNTTRTEGARKTDDLIFNPHTKTLISDNLQSLGLNCTAIETDTVQVVGVTSPYIDINNEAIVIDDSNSLIPRTTELGLNALFIDVGGISTTVTSSDITFNDGTYSLGIGYDILTDDRFITFPNKSGTIALTSDIPSGGSGTVTSISAGTGLTTSDGNAITTSGTLKAKLNSETSLGTIGSTSKLYAIGVDSNGQLCVKVSWSDIQTRSSDAGVQRTIYIVGDTSDSDHTGGLSKHGSLSFSVSANSATAGYTRLTLGNNTTSTTAGAKEGSIRIYGSKTSYTDLKVSASTTANTISFPDADGTVALQSYVDDKIPDLEFWLITDLQVDAIIGEKIVLCRGDNGNPVTYNDIIDFTIDYNHVRLFDQYSYIGSGVTIDNAELQNTFEDNGIYFVDFGMVGYERCPLMFETDDPVSGELIFSSAGNGFVVETYELFASSSISGGGHKSGTISPTKSGYYPIAIAGWDLSDQRAFIPNTLKLTAQSSGSATVTYDIANTNSSSRSGKADVNILWIKI